MDEPCGGITKHPNLCHLFPSQTNLKKTPMVVALLVRCHMSNSTRKFESLRKRMAGLPRAVIFTIHDGEVSLDHLLKGIGRL